jgi:geranylgeranyl pyrophosphate synthase
MEEQKLTKTTMAKAMKTSRASLDRLLDPDNPSVMLDMIESAASALGKRIRLELVDLTS